MRCPMVVRWIDSWRNPQTWNKMKLKHRNVMFSVNKFGTYTMWWIEDWPLGLQMWEAISRDWNVSLLDQLVFQHWQYLIIVITVRHLAQVTWMRCDVLSLNLHKKLLNNDICRLSTFDLVTVFRPTHTYLLFQILLNNSSDSLSRFWLGSSLSTRL